MKTLLVQQIEEAMRPLVGLVDVVVIHQHGLLASYEAYDRLAGTTNNIPLPLVKPKFQTCAEALAEAVKGLGISYEHLRNVAHEHS